MNNLPASFRPVKSEQKPLEVPKKQVSLPSSFRPKEPIQEKQEEVPDFFDEGFGPEFERETERHQARNMSRFLESVVGLPGDLSSFVAGLFGKEQNILPTSQKLQELSEKWSKGFTTPRNELEKFGDEVFKDVGTMLFPGAKQYNIARNIGIPIVGNLIKEGIKYSGADEKDAGYAKIGTMIVLDLMSQRRGMGGGAKKYASNLFREAENMVPEGAVADAKNLQNNLSKLKSNLEMGGKRPSTAKALDKVIEIENEIKNGKIPMKNLMAYRPAINEIVSELGGFEVQLPAAIKQKAIKNLHDVKRATIDAAEEWGTKHSPEFVKLNRSANEAWAAYENSNKITKVIQKVAGKYASPATKALFGIGIASGPTAAILAPSSLIPGLAAAGGYQTFKIFNRVKNSPTLRKYYADILSGAIKGNIGQVKANLKALDDGLKEKENQ